MENEELETVYSNVSGLRQCPIRSIYMDHGNNLESELRLSFMEAIIESMGESYPKEIISLQEEPKKEINTGSLVKCFIHGADYYGRVVLIKDELFRGDSQCSILVKLDGIEFGHGGGDGAIGLLSELDAKGDDKYWVSLSETTPITQKEYDDYISSLIKINNRVAVPKRDWLGRETEISCFGLVIGETTKGELLVSVDGAFNLRKIHKDHHTFKTLNDGLFKRNNELGCLYFYKQGQLRKETKSERLDNNVKRPVVTTGHLKKFMTDNSSDSIVKLMGAGKNGLVSSGVNYIGVNEDGLITYLPKGRIHKVNDDGKWSGGGRQSSSAWPLIRTLLKDSNIDYGSITSSDIEEFTNKLISFGQPELIWSESELPTDVYCDENRSHMGTLGDSCMNGDADYIEFYDINSSVVRILTARDKETNKLLGRALVWKVNLNGKDIDFVDRYYIYKDHLRHSFDKYAQDNGYWRKAQPLTYDYKLQWVDPVNSLEETVHAKIKVNDRDSEYPYIDTFTFGDDGWLSNSRSEWDWCYEYDSTGGERDDSEDTSNGRRMYSDNHPSRIES